MFLKRPLSSYMSEFLHSRASPACTIMFSCLLSLRISTYKYTPSVVSQIQLPCCAVIPRDPHQDTSTMVFGPSSRQNHEPWNSLYKLHHFVCFYRNTDSNHQFSGILTKLIFGENIVKKAMAWACLCSEPSWCRHWPHLVKQREP